MTREFCPSLTPQGYCESEHELGGSNPLSPIDHSALEPLSVRVLATLRVISVCVDAVTYTLLITYLRLLCMLIFMHICRFVHRKSRVLFFKGDLRNVQGF